MRENPQNAAIYESLCNVTTTTTYGDVCMLQWGRGQSWTGSPKPDRPLLRSQIKCILNEFLVWWILYWFGHHPVNKDHVGYWSLAMTWWTPRQSKGWPVYLCLDISLKNITFFPNINLNPIDPQHWLCQCTLLKMCWKTCPPLLVGDGGHWNLAKASQHYMGAGRSLLQCQSIKCSGRWGDRKLVAQSIGRAMWGKN